MMSSSRPPAVLALANGQTFLGQSVGIAGHSSGEIVFNTSMTGYQEILSDPSYAGQLVTLTASHIGNVGVNNEDVESRQAFLKGLVVRDLPLIHSNWRSNRSLSDELIAQELVGIAGIDTRELVRVLRTEGAQGACIMAASDVNDTLDTPLAIKYAQAVPSLAGQDLASSVTVEQAYDWDQGVWQLATGFEASIQDHSAIDIEKAQRAHVVAIDFGVKYNLLRWLTALGCRVTVVPAQTSWADVQALSPDGIFFSNGPGDPEPCDYAITLAKQIFAAELPVLGICLGHQILALACGASTFKMKFGHHGANHPVQDLTSKAVMITSQNHGFAVSDQDLPECMQVTHRSLFDQTIQGFRHTALPVYGFQGHPEASPGPHDARSVFTEFIAAMQSNNKRS